LLIRGQPEPVQKIKGESAGRSDALESRPPELPPALLRENEIALVRHDGDKQKQSARNR
jgi:hypothetical protein